MRFPFYLFILIIGLQFFASQGYSQYYFKHYQTDDGLVQNSVTAIMQDSKGLMWIGTRGGLSCFDGYTFKSFKDKKNKFGNIGNNNITAIAEDKKGMLWIGTGKGIFKYDPYKEVFSDLGISTKNYIQGIQVDKDNNVWFLGNTMLYKYIQTKKAVEDLHIHADCISMDKAMNLWLGDDDGNIIIYNTQNKNLTKTQLIDKRISANLRAISKIYPINNSEVLVGFFKQGLKYYNRKTGVIRSLKLSNSSVSNPYVRDIMAYGNQEYWVATESGVYIYNLAKDKSFTLKKLPGDPYAINDNAIYSLCKDNQGGMWVGTYFGGLNYYSSQNARFEKYYPIPGTNSLSGNAVGEICADSVGNLWIGTEDAGINKLNLQSGKFTNYTATEKSEDVSYPNIHGLLVRGNELLIGPFLHGLEIMDIPSGKIKNKFRVIGDDKNNTSDFIISIYQSKDSTLFIGTAYRGSGLFIYHPKLKTFKRINQIPVNSSVFHIVEDHDGNIWTGSESQGTFIYNPKTESVANVRFGDTVNGKIINEFPIHYMLEDSHHDMWFSTIGGGLIKLSRDRKTIKKFNSENGFPSNVLFGMQEDKLKHLWIGSNKGLICFNLLTEKSVVYTRYNGLITDQFNYNSAYKDVNGKMYFGSVAGLVAFNPADLGQKEASPPTYITSLQINNEEIAPTDKDSPLKKSILYTDTIVLHYDQNNFSIKFSALNYSSPKVTRYKYRLEGLDREWTYLSSNRNVYYTDLSPGKYKFTVQAESNIGSWIGNKRNLYIEILPPIWKSDAAYFLYALIFGATLYFSVRYYHQSQERKNANKLKFFEHEKVKEIYQAKIEFFTNIAHEIQTPLTLISVPVERVIETIDDYPRIRKSMLMIEKNTKRLVSLIGQLLDFRQTEIEQFGLNFVNVDINKMLEEQIDSFRELAGEHHIDFKISLPQKHVLAFVDREALIKICSNLISNAIKYGESQVTVEMLPLSSSSEKQFTIRFCNDGASIPQEYRKKIFEPFFRLRRNDKPGTGIGLPLAKSLTELHKGRLELISAETNNIIFELTLPVHQDIEFKLSSWKKIG